MKDKSPYEDRQDMLETLLVSALSRLVKTVDDLQEIKKHYLHTVNQHGKDELLTISSMIDDSYMSLYRYIYQKPSDMEERHVRFKECLREGNKRYGKALKELADL